MENIISLANALGWPIASVIVALIVLIIVWRLTGSTGSIRLKFRDWFNVERDASPLESSVSTARAISANNLVPAAPGDGDDDTKSSVDTVEEVAAGKTLDEDKHFLFEKDANELPRLFEKFKESESYRKETEFWESIYVDRRRELKIGDEEREFRALASSNHDWVWPLVFLIRRYIRLHNPVRARELLDEALQRNNSSNRKWVLREGVSLYHQMFGMDRVLQFIREQLGEGATDKEVSAMFERLAEYGDDDDPFSRAIADEIASNHELDSSRLFDLAFRYGSSEFFTSISFERYREMGVVDNSYVNVSNNMGVIVGSMDSSLQKDYYERALDAKSPVAISNLAKALADDGYVGRAEKLLADAEEPPVGSDGHWNLADARAKVASKRSDVDKARQKAESFAREQDKRFKALIFAGFEYFKKAGFIPANGRFRSEDGAVVLTVGATEAQCNVEMEECTFRGKLAKKLLCFEGSISSVESGILSSEFRRVLVVQVADEEFRALIWPKGFSLESPLRIVELSRTKEEKEGGNALHSM